MVSTFGAVPGAAVPGEAVPGAMTPGGPGAPAPTTPVLFTVGPARQVWAIVTARNS
jgi:hypothetical protein